MAWALLSPDLYWSTVTDTNTLDLVVDLPAGLDPHVNHIGVETILPQMSRYTVAYLDHKGAWQTLGTADVSEHFYFPAALFGNRVKLSLEGFALGNGKYLYGLGHLYVGLQHYVSAGRLVAPILFHNRTTSEEAYLVSSAPNPQTPNAPRQTDVLRFRIGTSATGSQLDDSAVLYDSNIDEYPIQKREIGPIAQDQAFLEVTFNRYQETTPTSHGMVAGYIRRTG